VPSEEVEKRRMGQGESAAEARGDRGFRDRSCGATAVKGAPWAEKSLGRLSMQGTCRPAARRRGRLLAGELNHCGAIDYAVSPGPADPDCEAASVLLKRNTR